MRIGVLGEGSGEARVAATPETVKTYVGLGAEVSVVSGAGAGAGLPDGAFAEAGAQVAADAAQAVRDADLVLAVRRPPAAALAGVRPGALVIAIMDPYGAEAALQELAGAGVTAFAMELMPRITRAQVMDVLSSQANLAGYRAVIEGAAAYGRALPMMMTAAGTIPAAKVFVMGVGVAGLQAIATARRLGAQVSATDVRSATREQIVSLGAKQDIVITTALIPGRAAPRLITDAQIATMKPGSVIFDLAVAQGGNVEGSVADQITDKHGVK